MSELSVYSVESITPSALAASIPTHPAAPPRAGLGRSEAEVDANVDDDVATPAPLLDATMLDAAVLDAAPLVLDVERRVLVGVDAQQLSNGEVALLRYLGRRPGTWHTSYDIALHVYHRKDVCARQLVWKYMSTLRKKLVTAAPHLIALCRRRGYSCQMTVVETTELTPM